MQQRIKRN